MVGVKDEHRSGAGPGRPHNAPPCQQRSFRLTLAEDYLEQYRFRLRWLRCLVERLGADEARLIWQASDDPSDERLARLLAEGWEHDESPPVEDVKGKLAAAAAEIFDQTLEGIDASEARALVEDASPMRDILDAFPDLDASREISTFDALHLFSHSIARMAETLIERHGKRGEMIAYDAMNHAQVSEQTERLPAATYLLEKGERFKRGYAERSLFTAGLERDILTANDRELHWHVTSCEWARYFRANHPKVGSILSCTNDAVLYGSYNERIRLQLKSTLMEGDAYCDFRLYALPEPDADPDE